MASSNQPKYHMLNTTPCWSYWKYEVAMGTGTVTAAIRRSASGRRTGRAAGSGDRRAARRSSRARVCRGTGPGRCGGPPAAAAAPWPRVPPPPTRQRTPRPPQAQSSLLGLGSERPRGPRAGQLTHGMGEHARRYEHVARALNEAGFVVYAQDHRGHGASIGAGEAGDLGQGGWPGLVGDVGLLSARIRAGHPGLPLILLGHSMGSFAVQQYLFDHSGDVDAVVLTGTAAIDLLEGALDLDQPMDLTAFNAPSQPARTDYNRRSPGKANRDAFGSDPP